jgi:hypothetical protein
MHVRRLDDSKEMGPSSSPALGPFSGQGSRRLKLATQWMLGLTELLDNLALVVGLFLSDRPSLLGARRLVVLFALGRLLFSRLLVKGKRPLGSSPAALGNEAVTGH